MRIILRSIIILLAMWMPMVVLATHNRAGEITYRHVSGYTFEFVVTTYTYSKSQANRNVLTVYWGDDTYQNVSLSNREILPNDYYYNTYIAQHTFPGPGTYQILMEDPNRNLGVKNIPNSVNTIFSIQTTMLIGPFVGTNTTPFLLNPPIDNAARNHVFVHNPGAYDIDGDSISYQLTSCTAEGGNPIDGFVYPTASDSLYIDPYSGNLVWNTPVDTGVYNIAMYINEWRNGVRIGRITRDMQIDVYNTDNNPPVNSPISDYCIEAGDSISFYITSTDADGDSLTQYMIGTPRIDNSGSLETVSSGPGFIASVFTWKTDCSHARQQPHNIIIKTEDKLNEVNLVDITNFNVKVLPNAPKNLTADPKTDQIALSWDQSSCGVPYGYNIYRRKGSYDFTPDSCENGVPSYTGFKLIDFVQGNSTTTYIDDDQGQGLVPGFDYCYRITAIYYDGVESFSSEEVCTSLIPGVPAILEVSVLSDHATQGEISVKWAAPINFDTVDDGPYLYEIYRMVPGEEDYSLVATIPTVDFTDTSYTDKNINTLIYPYNYSVRLLYQADNGDWVIHPGYETASSLYLELVGNDNQIAIDMLKRSPWLNYLFDIYRSPENIDSFELIDTSNISTYIDDNLPNLVPYTYRVVSTGLRPINGNDFITRNTSHIASSMAIDSTPPCNPVASVASICDSSYNILQWTSPLSICGHDDIIRYEIYYRPSLNIPLELINTTTPPDTTFIHRDDLETLAAQYGVVAVDSFGNKSDMALVIIDSCLMFHLPNVFTPDNDGSNDIYTSWNRGGFIKSVDMKIFNRYGQSVYETTDPDINWDGRYKVNGKLVSTGVYYYVCDYYEPRITGPEHKVLKGFIHVFSGTINSNTSE